MCFPNFGRLSNSISPFALLLLFLASNFAFLLKTAVCTMFLKGKQSLLNLMDSGGCMLYAPPRVNNLLHLIEFAKWVQVLPAAGPHRLHGSSRGMQSQRSV